MSETIIINIADAAEDSICVTREDGTKVFIKIVEQLHAGNKVNLSFSGVDSLTISFLNEAIGQLYGEYSEVEIRASLSVSDIMPDHANKLKLMVENAKDYAKKKGDYDNAMREEMGDD